MSLVLLSHIRKIPCCRVAVVLGVAFFSTSAHAERLALVIGNSAYIEEPLRNPVNDARAMDAKFRSMRFRTTLALDLKRDDIGRVVSDFVRQIKPGDDIAFFYAGHGLQLGGVNFLPAVDARIRTKDDAALNSLNLNSLVEQLDDAKAGVKLLFLDACRSNPFGALFRGGTRGLARMGDAVPSGTLIQFATRPGKVAADGDGSHGLYTEKLLVALDKANEPVEQTLKRAANLVLAASQGEQDPWIEGHINGDFCFLGCNSQADIPSQKQPSISAANPQPPLNAKASGFGTRVALIVGNGDYADPSLGLKNPVNDARAMDKALRNVGFTTITKFNVNRVDLNTSVAEFGAALAKDRNAVGLFFYSGQTLQIHGKNYLLPVDAQVGPERLPEFVGLDLDRLTSALAIAENAMNIVVVDACNGSFAPKIGGPGLSSLDVPKNFYLAYSASPGQSCSYDGAQFGLYPSEIIKAMEVSRPLEATFKAVRLAVRQSTGGRQTPWEISSLRGDFYFRPPDALVNSGHSK